MQAVGQAVAIALGILFIIIQVGAFPMSDGGSVSLRTNLLAIVVKVWDPLQPLSLLLSSRRHTCTW